MTIAMYMPLSCTTPTSTTIPTPSNTKQSNHDNYNNYITSDRDALAILLSKSKSKSEERDAYGWMLQTCTRRRALTQGKQLHAQLIVRGFQLNTYLGTKLVTMYGFCSSADHARLVFDKMPHPNVFLCTAVINAYVQNEFFLEAVTIFSQMPGMGIQPDNFTYACVLKALAALSALSQGKQIHNHIIRRGIKTDSAVENSLMALYAHCGKLHIARQLFDKMPQRNVISWSSVTAGYARNGCVNEALNLFRTMQFQLHGFQIDWFSITSALAACSHTAALPKGKEIHGRIVKSDVVPDVLVWNALIDMYANCGCVEIARKLFDRMRGKNVVSWNALIGGYGRNGYGEVAVELFKEMVEAGFVPNHITLIHVLCACSHSGLVEQSWQIFNSMSENFHIIPRAEHYACMVDLLGRAGCLDEAHHFIQNMPMEVEAVSNVWGALLAACRVHGNIELAEEAVKHVFEMDPENNGYYVILSNMYAAAGRWDDVTRVRKMMEERGLKKTPGCSWVYINSTIYTFTAGDNSPPQSEQIYAMLQTLSSQIKEMGYVPQTNYVLSNVDEEEKETMLCGHSEKLAVAFALINTNTRATPIRVMKNLRICGDCHSVIKFISKIVGQEIIVRDTNRFHHFKDGVCSCGDYW